MTAGLAASLDRREGGRGGSGERGGSETATAHTRGYLASPGSIPDAFLEAADLR